MEISAENTKLMIVRAEPMRTKLQVNETDLETVRQFKHLGTIISVKSWHNHHEKGSKPEVFARVAQISEVLARLKPIWKDKNIFLGSKVKLLRRSLIFSIFLYSCESWTLAAKLQRNILAGEMR
ncbi:endonuclease-reverse transcriptase [Elysia marginata]|uniref:Endonuclease-reverse transcriptase n=1 Tax=Elysia marginata TaxID=1093978 RepID=A0AAV4G8E5_9GAST|nr:endonuclease-reverse transcriptase [Elysia marginata]